MAPVKKSKSAKNSESINSRLQLVVKSGKVGLHLDQMCSLEDWIWSSEGNFEVMDG